MAARERRRPPRALRWVAALLIRGPAARFILRDLDDLLARDIEHRLTRRRALWRYGRNLLGSALTVWWARFHLPRGTGISWLDLKLGARMLVKYPGLTFVGGLAIASAVAVGAGGFEFLDQLISPTLPLDEGDRIVGIRLWHTASSSVEEQALYDFVTWRDELETVRDLGAFRTLARNLITGEGQGEPVEVAEISASAFRLARVAPLLGRSLVETDERFGAPAIVVIGYDLWQTRFEGDPGIVGRAVRLGSSQSTVVGVMPENFTFPVTHSLWVPFRVNILDYVRRQGPEIYVFGRLTDGVTLDEAQAELTSLGLRAAADFPDTHEYLRPQVLPYAQSITGITGVESLALRSINVFLVMLLVLVCGNVALLMFARAATRESELVVRNALGASRGQIVMQLFTEALVLGGVAAVIGLAAAGSGLRWWLRVFEIESGGRLPFWFSDSLAPATVLYAGALAVLGAVIAGVVPALKVTGRRVEARLRQSAAGAGGVQFGGVWTAVIIAQVAVTVAFPATAFFARRHVVEVQSLDGAFSGEEYLSVRLEMDRETPPGTSADAARAEFLARFGATVQELERRLTAEPGVVGVTFADRLPRTLHRSRPIEVDGEAASPDSGLEHRASIASISVDFFEVLDTPILAGRAFHSGDLASDRRVVIVNASFVHRVLADRNPIGHRVRYLPEDRGEARSADEEPGPWYEIVGVVGELGMISGDVEPGGTRGLYHPMELGDAFPIHMAVQLGPDPESFAPRFRAIAAAVDPTLRLHEILPLNELGQTMWLEMDFLSRLLAGVSSIALILSLAGIYSFMSFTVSRRTREIGIRIALGSDKRRIFAAIFRRPLLQVGTGVLVGGVLVAALSTAVLLGLSVGEAALIAAYATLMMGVCMLACIVPTRRALRVEPTEALRAEG